MPLNLGWVTDGRDPGRGRAVRCPHRQAVTLNSLELRAAGDQEDVVPRLEQTAADAAADPGCAADDVAQLPALVLRCAARFTRIPIRRRIKVGPAAWFPARPRIVVRVRRFLGRA